MKTHRNPGVTIRSIGCILLLSAVFLSLPASSTSGQTSGGNTIFNPMVSTVGQCGVNQVIYDPADDVVLAHVDVTWLSTSINGETLNATLKMRNLPNQLTFDREGVAGGIEYEWSVIIDIDNNTQTGDSFYPYIGAEYLLSVTHNVVNPNTPVTLPIADGVQANIWQFDLNEQMWVPLSEIAATVDPGRNTITYSGSIPGMSKNAIISFASFDFNPDGTPETDSSKCNALP